MAKAKCVFAKNETALRLGGAAAVSVPYFPTRPSARLPTSPRRYPPQEAAWEQSSGSCLTYPGLLFTLECSKSGSKGQ